MLALEEGAGLAVLVGAMLLTGERRGRGRRQACAECSQREFWQAFCSSFVLSFAGSMAISAGSVIAAAAGRGAR